MQESTRIEHGKATVKLAALLTECLLAAEAAGGDMRAVEQAGARFVLSARTVVMTASVETSATEFSSSDVRCRQCGKDGLSRSRRVRRVVSEQGEALYRSHRYRCERCGKDRYPFEEMNDLVGNQFTVGARAVIAQTACHMAYAPAAEHLAERGIAVSPREVDRIAREVAEWRHADEDSVATAAACRSHIEDETPIPALPTWQGWEHDTPAVLSVDGAMVRSPEKGPQGLEWYECRAGVIADATDGGRASAFHTAGVVSPDAIFQQLRTAWESDPRRNRPALFLADGGAWIWPRVSVVFPNARQVLDIYHAAEHVAEAARAAWGDSSAKAERWRKALMTRDGPERVRAKLRRQLENGEAVHEETLRRELQYLQAHSHRMPYWDLIQAGLPIGSGVMESAIKQVATTRLRGPGMKWTRTGADAMLRLRSAVLSHSLQGTIQRRMRPLRAQAHQPC